MAGTFRHSVTIFAAAMLAAALMDRPAAGQGRRGVSISSPGSTRTVGGTGPSYNFIANSYGLGTAQTQGRAGEDVLRSSIGASPGFSLNRPTGAGPQNPVGASLQSPELTGAARSHQMWDSKIFEGEGLATSASNLPYIQDADKLALRAASDYLKVIDSTSILKAKQSEPVTSLVPSADSFYMRLMAKGEAALRDGRYNDAIELFRYANEIDRRVPESLISLLHASFAVSQYSYGRAAFYLKESLRYFPELPLTALRPKEFYTDQAKFVHQLIDLEDHVEKNPDDTEGLLLLSYFRWFQQQPDVAAVQNSLSKAMQIATRKGDRDTIEAIETFWNGALASGQASGELGTTTTRPAGGTTTAPATEPKPASGVEAAKAEQQP